MDEQIDPHRFGMQNGAGLLSGWFKHIRLYHYEDELIFDEPQPIFDYLLSEAQARQRLKGENCKHSDILLKANWPRKARYALPIGRRSLRLSRSNRRLLATLFLFLPGCSSGRAAFRYPWESSRWSKPGILSQLTRRIHKW